MGLILQVLTRLAYGGNWLLLQLVAREIGGILDFFNNVFYEECVGRMGRANELKINSSHTACKVSRGEVYIVCTVLK